MKKAILFCMICLAAVTTVNAQKWEELTEEQKYMKLKEFRADNQKYLKEKLGMTTQQLDDIDNVNVCYLSTLDRIERYGKKEENMEKAAEAVTAARSVQLDIIMGEDKHKKFMEYVREKINKENKQAGK